MLHKILVARIPLRGSEDSAKFVKDYQIEIRDFTGLSVPLKKDDIPDRILPASDIDQEFLDDILSIKSMGNDGPLLQTAMVRRLDRYVYIIDRRGLAFYVAKAWGLDFEYANVPPSGHKIGHYQEICPVVILSNVSQERVLQLLEIRENLQTERLTVITTKRLSLTEREKERLYSQSIILLTSLDFISPESQVRWDLVDFGKCALGTDAFKHSADYRSIIWQGDHYPLSAMRAGIVRALHEGHKNETPEMGQAYLLESVGSKSSRLEHVFKNSPLWGTLIVPGDGKGTFRLKIS